LAHLSHGSFFISHCYSGTSSGCREYRVITPLASSKCQRTITCFKEVNLHPSKWNTASGEQEVNTILLQRGPRTRLRGDMRCGICWELSCTSFNGATDSHPRKLANEFQVGQSRRCFNGAADLTRGDVGLQ
jgi:hypothetical protein